ncbi:hypothetical protein BDV10DRAFT_2707 [Aspergillus recurvatus]
MGPDTAIPTPDEPPVFNYILSFLLVGIAWGFTTPFIRRAAADFQARQEQKQQPQQTELQPTGTQFQTHGHDNANDSGTESDEDQPLPARPSDHSTTGQPSPAWMNQSSSSSTSSWLRTRVVSLFWTVVNLLRTPAYSVPLVINLTGSVWFFLLVGKHELSLTVPLANSSAFLFTVLGEWYVEKKVIARETWLGMALVLGGIAICVQSKS